MHHTHYTTNPAHLARRGQRLDLVDEHKHEALAVLHELGDLGEQLGHLRFWFC
jgi:hypothetical protein